MTEVAIVDDEPLNREHLRSALLSARPGITEADTFGSLSSLIQSASVRNLTHAIVDLSFGILDRTGEPLHGTGIDVIDHLRAAAPDCDIVVMTRFDGDPLMPEMVVAIRQTWPAIRFLHKADAHLIDRVLEFLDGRLMMDNAAFAATVAGVRPITPQQLREHVYAGMYGRSVGRVLVGLASWPRRPSAQELAETVHLGRQSVRTMLQWCGDTFRAQELLGYDEPAGLERLWPWARARQAILRRAFVDS